MRKYVIICSSLIYVMACSEPENKTVFTDKQLFKFNCITMELPSLYHVDSVKHWDIGNIYRIWNLKDTVMMDFHLGVSTQHSGAPKENLMTNEFVIDTIIHDFEQWNDRILKRRRVILQSKRQIRGGLLPFFVELTCYLDFTDLLICENIISSVQMSKNCLGDDE